MFLEVYPQVIGDSTVKRCAKCGEVKPTSDFPLIYRNANRTGASCKKCLHQYYLANKERAAEYQRQYKRTNKERIAARNRAYYIAKRDERAQYAREYRATHKVARAAYLREWRAANKEHSLNRDRKYRAQNAEAIREKRRIHHGENPHIRLVEKQRRRAREAGAQGSFSAADIQQLRAAQTDKRGRLRCWWCGQVITETPHVDHRIALSVGGTNYPGNLCLACPACNMSKQHKSPSEWAGRLL